ncbi:hypothetical protein [Undibacterium sp. TS12]|uniref:hypothetical protein n=1 Tax=Undibacterium sp. TS12 TaxID=2908202 RepID=UPI001F4C6A4D|nr:hypothetical protein [Undibacterium sp. TS12]MCH8619582.1 hypothetical protein [Undibacterium sp. TS12]
MQLPSSVLAWFSSVAQASFVMTAVIANPAMALVNRHSARGKGKKFVIDTSKTRQEHAEK